MTAPEIDEKFLYKLRSRSQSARKEVLKNSYFGGPVERRLDNFADCIEGGLGGDVGIFLGMLNPGVVDEMTRLIFNYRNILGNIHRLSASKAIEIGEVPSEEDGKARMEKLLFGGSAVMIPVDSLQVRIDQLTAENARLTEKLGDVQIENDKLRTDLRATERTIRSLNEHVDELVTKDRAQVDQIGELSTALNSAAETNGNWKAANELLSNDVSESMDRITSWVNAYRNPDGFGGMRLPELVNAIVNGYGNLHVALSQANASLGNANDRVEQTLELIREIDVLGAYLNHPHAGSEDRLETLKSALTELEDKDELIGELQRALTKAQSGQPRRPGPKTTQKPPEPSEPMDIKAFLVKTTSLGMKAADEWITQNLK